MVYCATLVPVAATESENLVKKKRLIMQMYGVPGTWDEYAFLSKMERFTEAMWDRYVNVERELNLLFEEEAWHRRHER